MKTTTELKEELRELRFEAFRVKRGTEKGKQEVNDKIKKCKRKIAKTMMKEYEQKENGGMKR